MKIKLLNNSQKFLLIALASLGLLPCSGMHQFAEPENIEKTIPLSQASALQFLSCKLVWEDDFASPELDPEKWRHNTGDGCDQNNCGWGNKEQQWYQPENAIIKNGILHIIARREDNSVNKFTSSKITTNGLFSQKFGRFEARIKTPDQLGAWPAFWMMPQFSEHPWPIEGEIDIIEQSGKTEQDAKQISGAAHYGDIWPHNVYYTDKLINSQSWGNDFHIYRIDWTEDSITWSVDDKVYAYLHKNDLKNHQWPFAQKEFYLILNIALGGNLGGTIPNKFTEAILEVDYVRVYKSCKNTELKVNDQ